MAGKLVEEFEPQNIWWGLDLGPYYSSHHSQRISLWGRERLQLSVILWCASYIQYCAQTPLWPAPEMFLSLNADAEPDLYCIGRERLATGEMLSQKWCARCQGE